MLLNFYADEKEWQNVGDRDPQKREKAQACYRSNYERLYQGVSGAWFSFGDERLMRQSLYDLASSTHGKQLFANLSSSFSGLSSTRDFDNPFARGAFFVDQDAIKLKSSAISEYTKFSTTRVIAHELLHATQKKMGFTNVDGLSPKQSVQRGFLCEAEAYSWDGALYMTQQLFGKLNPSKEEIQKLIDPKSPYGQQKMKEILSNLKEGSKLEGEEILNTLYKNLQKSGGDLYYAQRKAVGVGMCQFMNPRENSFYKDLKRQYENQVIGNINMDVESLSSKGNEQEVQRYYDYLAKQYGVSRSQLEKGSLSNDLNNQLAQVEVTVLKRESDTKFQKEEPDNGALRHLAASGKNITNQQAQDTALRPRAQVERK